jgi:hypothetical protein
MGKIFFFFFIFLAKVTNYIARVYLDRIFPPVALQGGLLKEWATLPGFEPTDPLRGVTPM